MISFSVGLTIGLAIGIVIGVIGLGAAALLIGEP